MEKNSLQIAHESTLDVFSSIATEIIGEIENVFEFGARDCRETMAFHKNFPKAEIYTFECNPETLPICREKIKDAPQIHLIEKAVSDKEGELTFYQNDKEKTETPFLDGNQGASSLFQANPDYPEEHYIQKPIKVTSVTLESFLQQNPQIKNIDMLWMDIQGSELNALRGAGKRLSDIKLIHTEVEFFEMYKQQPLYKDIKKFLTENGFQFLCFSSFGKYAADAIFVNKKFSNKKFIIPERIQFYYNLTKEKVTGKARGLLFKTKKLLKI